MATTFGILGATALLMDGRIKESWGRPRERAVLATLLVHAGRWVSLDTLIEWAWPEDEPLPRHPASTFHGYATRIRRSLHQLSSPPDLEPSRGTYRLNVDRSQIDYHLFRSLIGEARQHSRTADHQLAAECAERALGLWRGLPLSDLSSAPAQAWRARVLHNEWIPAHVTWIQALVETGELDEALVRLDDLQADHALDVRLATLRLTVLHGLHRRSDSTAYYFATRRQLQDMGDDQAAEHLRRHQDTLSVGENDHLPRVDSDAVGPRQLPYAVPDFVGRTSELAALDAAATTASGECTSGVVILDGMSGVGKTALAVQWGHRNRHRFPDGDLHVNLAGFSAGPMVAPATVVDDFLIALGHHPAPNLSGRARELLLSRLLTDRRVLVVLDNARDSAHVQGLLPLLSGCFVVLTSRQQMSAICATTGARRVRVSPMNTTETADLLSRRLAARRHLEQEHLSGMAELCSGNPLAALLLAEHVATRPDVSLTEFAKHLDRYQLIAHVGDNSDGSVNLHTMFLWSYQALPEPEQRLFRLLGVHPGSDISVEAACAGDGRSRMDSVKSLGLLVGAHLLEQPEAFDRYRFHDLLAVFAADRAHATEPEPARTAAELRYLSFYLASAIRANDLLYPSQLAASELPIEDNVEPMAFVDSAHATRWFDQERTNLVAVVCAGAALGHHEHVWRLADAASTFFDRHGYYEDSRTVRTRGASSARSAGDAVGEASCLVGLGMVHMILGDHERARWCFDTALRLVEGAGHDRGQATVLHHLAMLAVARGDLATAIELYQRSLDIVLRIQDQEAMAWVHCRLAEALRLSDQLGDALVHLHRAQWFAQSAGDRSAHATILVELGSLYLDQNDEQAALTYCEQALKLAEEIPDFAVVARACIALAEINVARHETEAAVANARRAIAVCEQTHNLTGEARGYDALGDTLVVGGHAVAAIDAWRRSATLHEHLGNARQAGLIEGKITAGSDVSVPIRDDQ